VLPPDLPSWSRHEAGQRDPVIVAAAGDGSIAAYVATHDRRFVVLALDVDGPMTLRASVPVDLRVVHPVSGAVLREGALDASATVTVTGSAAYIITGEATS
jgi:hypothetical protein